MTIRIPRTPLEKRMKIVMMKQNIPQRELVRCLGLASSTVSDMIYGGNRCEKTKERIVEIPGTRVN